MRSPRLVVLAVIALAFVAASAATFVPLAGTAVKGTDAAADTSSSGLGVSFQPGVSSDAGLDAVCPTVVSNTHSYRVCNIGHPAETALAAGMNGKVWALNSARPQYSTDGGLNWIPVSMPAPGNIGGVIYPEGDIIVAPNGDILTNWLTVDYPHTAALYVSTNGGTTFQLKPLSGVYGFPDRPWIVTSATVPADPSNPLQPSPYSAVAEAGTGAKVHWVSGTRGEAWYPKVAALLASQVPVEPFPVGVANPYLDYSKPFAQGYASKYLVLGNGQILDLLSKRLTYDFVEWTTFSGSGTWPAVNQYPWWDTAADGTIYAAGFFTVGGVWQIKYKWFDGTWHDGAVQPTLTAKPDYPNGLGTGSAPASHDAFMAIKSHGAMLGFNTRQGFQDVLIRIDNATSPSATWTKDVVGPGGSTNERYDYPNLVFDSQGRAIMSYKGSWVAYATTV